MKIDEVLINPDKIKLSVNQHPKNFGYIQKKMNKNHTKDIYEISYYYNNVYQDTVYEDTMEESKFRLKTILEKIISQTLKHLEKYENYVYYNKKLNDVFWADDKFDERIREKLIAIALDFYNSFKFDIKPEDIVLTGSICNYNYNKYSDLDVHIVVDFTKINSNTKLVKIAVDNKRLIWNMKHNIHIKGHDLELYIQDSNEKHVSTGEYSLLNNMWLKKPSYNPPKIDDNEVVFKYKNIKSGIDQLEEISETELTPEESNKYYNIGNMILEKIMKMRKLGLEERGGEFSIENLVYKRLRNDSDDDRLRDIINTLYDKIYIQ